jgi:hypothetical protein
MRAIEMKWRGTVYTIPADRAFKAAMQVEDIVTFSEVHAWGAQPKVYKLAAAFGAMLRFAGARVTDEAIVKEILRAGGDGQVMAMEAFNSLIHVLTSGAPDDVDVEAEPKKRKASSKPSL